ncbi:D-2-hydroxyacid dehydrogenase [Novacetimonas pomaceti]|uniref:Hydroxyacid dehydrogenase n=1 Tax=Novacetimonas pomaceti TaxID=2021998 RepID=A0A318Q9S2_9PROT|nr:D-2-hydroxyacid dehydrogenase [Novacetimonas pomaceti]PYD75450.1 hydroxyacid dehydrogenase [Novacetimonas pomaceti]
MPHDQIPCIYAAHSYYDIRRELEKRPSAPPCIQVTTLDDLKKIIADAEILVISMLWKNDLLEIAPRLRLIQSISSGVEQFDLNRLKARGVHLCNARGANASAVAEHALALMLSLARRLYEARDNQKMCRWSTTGTDPRPRLQELSEKNVLIVGMGTIGDRLARLCQALGMNVSGARHSARPLDVAGVRQITMNRLHEGLADADYVILTCPLTPQTHHLINTAAFAAMKRDACLINVARGAVVEEAALIHALDTGRIAGAALDTYDEEPLPASSPLWSRPNLVMTGHTAGETQFYERNVVDILLRNLAALKTGGPMTNMIV